MRRVLLGAGVVAMSLLLFPSQSQAQIPGGLDPEMIKQQIRDTFPKIVEAAEEATIEIEGVCKIKYKKIPTDPKKIAKMLGQQMGAGLPPGMDKQIDQYMGMFMGEITQLLNENMEDVGSFEALVELKLKSKSIPVGVHRIGLVFNGERPKAIKIFNKDKEKMKKPLEIRLKTKGTDLQEELKITLKEPKKQVKGKEKFDIEMVFLRFKAKSKTKLVVSSN